MFDYTTAKYIVNKVPGFDLDLATRLWKTRFETLQECITAVAAHPALGELAAHITSSWDTIVPLTVQEALQEKNIEHRRLFFWAIGVIRIFRELDPVLLDKQTIVKNNNRWDADMQPYTEKIEDTYELYQIDGNKIFNRDTLDTVPGFGQRPPMDVYAVRCWCTSTNREYWIYVNRTAAFGSSWASDNDKPDAVRAIAWTIRLDINKPEKIYRQGDVIIAKASNESRKASGYHLSKEDYLRLMYSES
jgi:hypothetical protein